MKNKKLIVLYILMLLTGFFILFTNTSNTQTTSSNQGTEAAPQVRQKEVAEFATVAVASKDIHKGKILNADDYTFKDVEVQKSIFDKTKYVSLSGDIDSYAAKNNGMSTLFSTKKIRSSISFVFNR